MSTVDKYPHLSNADLAELIGLNRLLQFEKLPQRFKDMPAYVPYGHDLIELIQERLRVSTDDTDIIGVDQTSAIESRHCLIDLSYYFTRNADLGSMLRATFEQYHIEFSRPRDQVIEEILTMIKLHDLVAKCTPADDKYFLLAAWDIVDLLDNDGNVVGRSLLDDWVITSKSDQPAKAEPGVYLNPDLFVVEEAAWNNTLGVTARQETYSVNKAVEGFFSSPLAVIIDTRTQQIRVYTETSCGDYRIKITFYDKAARYLSQTFVKELPDLNAFLKGPHRHMNPDLNNSITGGVFRPFHFYSTTNEKRAILPKLEKALVYMVFNNLPGFEEGINLQDCIKEYINSADGQPWYYDSWGPLEDFVHRVHMRMDSDMMRKELPNFNVIAILYKDHSVDVHLEAIAPGTYG